MFPVDEDEHIAAQNILIHHRSDQAAQAVKMLTQIGWRSTEIIPAGSREMKHALSDQSF